MLDELDYIEIGVNIRTHRKKGKMRQADLAELANVTSQHISHIETANTKVSLSTLVAIANSLKTDANSLLGKNLNSSQKEILTGELAEVVHYATAEQLDLCVKLCKAVMECKDKK